MTISLLNDVSARYCKLFSKYEQTLFVELSLSKKEWQMPRTQWVTVMLGAVIGSVELIDKKIEDWVVAAILLIQSVFTERGADGRALDDEGGRGQLGSGTAR